MPPVKQLQVRGYVHPHIKAAARAIMRAGWRATSLFRPDGSSHNKGTSLDVAPLTYHDGGFGHNTARLIFQLLERELPGVPFTVVAENDHVHIELAHRYPVGSGILTDTGVIMHPRNQITLADHPYGDPTEWEYLDEFGDPFDDEDTIVLYTEDGDPVEVLDADDDDLLEIGAPRLRKKRAAKKAARKAGLSRKQARKVGKAVAGRPRQQARLAKKPGVQQLVARALGAQRLSSSEDQKTDPLLQAQLNARKELRNAAAPDLLFERYKGIDTRVSGSLPPNARLRWADVAAVSTLIMANPLFSPQVFPATITGSTTLEWTINSDLTAVLGAGTIFDWVGDIIRIENSALNATPSAFTVIRTIQGVTTEYTYTIPAMTNLAVLTMINGRLVASVPRLANGRVTVDPVPDPSNKIVIQGLPTATWSAQLRFLVPGDSEVEGLLAKMG